MGRYALLHYSRHKASNSHEISLAAPVGGCQLYCAPMTTNQYADKLLTAVTGSGLEGCTGKNAGVQAKGERQGLAHGAYEAKSIYQVPRI